MDNYIVGRNAVKEALKAGRSIQRILVSDDKIKTGLSDIVGLAKSKGIEVRPTPVKQMNRYETDVPHQGVIAFVNAVEFKDLGEVLQESNHENPLLILTDGVEDPHNMGAIIRTAECVGATAVLIPKRHNAPINATVAKTSAGAVEQIPLVQVGNVTQTIKQLQKQGFWVLGAHMEGDRTFVAIRRASSRMPRRTQENPQRKPRRKTRASPPRSGDPRVMQPSRTPRRRTTAGRSPLQVNPTSSPLRPYP